MLLWDEFQRKEEYKNRELAIRTCVLALLERTKIPPSPLLWTQPGVPPGQQVERIRFSYEVIELWKIPYKVLLNLGHLALYPLLPLTQGGTTREITVTMFDRLSGEPNHLFALIGFAFATLMFKMLKQYEDMKWLKERFWYMDDIIRESPLYQWISEEIEAKSIAKGIAKGIAEGVAQTRQAVVDFVQEHFPTQAQLAEEVVATIDNQAQLLNLLVRLGGAQNEEQALKILSELAQ
jgi:predicted transposase YdaD